MWTEGDFWTEWSKKPYGIIYWFILDSYEIYIRFIDLDLY